MKAETKRKWVEALRSRKFKQGIGYLKNEKTKGKIQYCCLGVLHEVDGGKWNLNEFHGRYETGGRQTPYSDSQMLNGKFTRGLSETELNNLTDMNDERGYKFYQIANWIEKNIKTKG